MEMEMEGRRNLIGWILEGDGHVTWRWWSKMSVSCHHLKPSKAHKIRLSEGDQISHNSLSIWVEFPVFNFSILNLQEYDLSIYSRRGLKMKRHNSKTRLFKIGAKTSHMRSMTCFPTLTPSKTISTPTLLCHMEGVTLFCTLAPHI